jgi:hypothetical protein
MQWSPHISMPLQRISTRNNRQRLLSNIIGRLLVKRLGDPNLPYICTHMLVKLVTRLQIIVHIIYTTIRLARTVDSNYELYQEWTVIVVLGLILSAILNPEYVVHGCRLAPLATPHRNA